MDDSISDTVLAETPARVLKFLGAVSRSSRIRSTLATRGYGDEDHQEGWSLLLKDSGYANPKPPTGATEAAKATAELDAWDEPNFRVIRATLERRFPDQAKFVFANDLAPSTGAGAVLSVATLLGRLKALKDASDRKATRKQDHAALAVLDQKGYSAAELARLAGLVETASQAAPVVDPSADRATEDEQRAARLAVRAWFDEWSETARAIVKRRDDLIALGLAARRSSDKTAPANGGAPSPPAPSAPAKA